MCLLMMVRPGSGSKRACRTRVFRKAYPSRAQCREHTKRDMELCLDQSFERNSDHWQPSAATLSMTDGLPMEAEIDMPVMAFLNQLDGTRPLRAAIDAFAEAAAAPVQKVAADFLPITRLFIARGFIVPA